jgi:hypothetical protein
MLARSSRRFNSSLCFFSITSSEAINCLFCCPASLYNPAILADIVATSSRCLTGQPRKSVSWVAILDRRRCISSSLSCSPLRAAFSSSTTICTFEAKSNLCHLPWLCAFWVNVLQWSCPRLSMTYLSTSHVFSICSLALLMSVSLSQILPTFNLKSANS